MTKDWPSPNIKPFSRLNVTDGLLMNAERWRLAHNYHLMRQNVHFQSLNQPGIVCELGVCVISPPDDLPAQYRDGRWVQIQPGIAIDLFGNFIVIDQAIDFRIVSETNIDEGLMVYLVATYVDPDKLRRRDETEVVMERFRIDEKNSPPNDHEVELCRILIKPGEVELSSPQEVFYPSFNQLDLRYRQQARSRPQSLVRVAVLASDPEQAYQITQLTYLLQSVSSLYPALEGISEIGKIVLESSTTLESLWEYDLICISEYKAESLQLNELEILKKYMALGGIVLGEFAAGKTNISQLFAIKQELEKTINDLGGIEEVAQALPELEAEFVAITNELDTKRNQIYDTIGKFAENLEINLQFLANLDRSHLLRNQPFLFAALPTINHQPIELMIGGGMIVVVGDLSSAWGLDEQLSYSRETIRTAQEMGINILNFAWRRRQLTQLQLSYKEVVSR
ncbi:MAG: hypothetical protein WBV73_27595 [Phormidium sp.]